MSVPVNGEVDICAEDFYENRMPMLIIQQATQGEGHAGVRRGKISFA